MKQELIKTLILETAWSGDKAILDHLIGELLKK